LKHLHENKIEVGPVAI